MVNGNAWLIEKVISVENANEEIISLGKINTKKEAVSQENFIKKSWIKIKLLS